MRSIGNLIYTAVLLISGITADITTPIPTTPTPSSAAIINPTLSDPDIPATSAAGASWCVALQSASQAAIQSALDYACGHGADCSAIQPAGDCYRPNTVRDHASFAFNSYYQKNPLPTSCNFGGTAIITSTDPSYVNCQFPTTSTSSSILNTTNSIGSTVFGGGPIITPTSSSVMSVMHDFNFIISNSLVILILIIFL